MSEALSFEVCAGAVEKLRARFPDSHFTIVTLAGAGAFYIEARVPQGPHHRKKVMRIETPEQLAGLLPSTV